ncbi:hypothetical protein CBS101457_005581 [Exobasidium rhododendri]|nr:hypothetical protein CBS101457_005581 [Exobasidium rhododendri]
MSSRDGHDLLSPLPASPSYANESSGNGNYYSSQDVSRFGGTSSESFPGESDLGPYSALNQQRRTTTTTRHNSYDDDQSSVESSGERLIENEGGRKANSAALEDVAAWGMRDTKTEEADDYLHDPRGVDQHSHAISLRGFLNVLTLFCLVAGLLMLFAGYPILYHFLKSSTSTSGSYNLGGTNGTGQVGVLTALRSLIDSDTPSSATTFTSTASGKSYNLQFSDEFETDGRTFWPGDDQNWEAVDIWYGATQDYEWYSPENINTTGGALVITMTDHPTHDLNFQSGMLQSWNKLCFQGGYIEFSIIQPGSHTTSGYWPAAWLMGNLGRPGYLATTDGMWPYSYQGCDTGILPNQTNAAGGPIQAVKSSGEYTKGGNISELPGMRTPSCTCAGEDHPGPNVKVGRSSPELDILEAQIKTESGVKNSYASQSMQIAPFDEAYYWVNSTPAATIIGDDTIINTYVGGVYQESVSAVSLIPQRGFADYDAPDSEKWVKFGVEYEPDWDLNGGGFVTWYVDGLPTWTVTGATVPASTVMEISQRNIPVEPMAIIMNLGMSTSFQTVDFTDTGVSFPAQLKFDYVRIYQEKGKEKLSCDPADYPTAAYISNHTDVYQNPNATTWNSTAYAWPKNSLRSGC